MVGGRPLRLTEWGLKSRLGAGQGGACPLGLFQASGLSGGAHGHRARTGGAASLGSPHRCSPGLTQILHGQWCPEACSHSPAYAQL